MGVQRVYDPLQRKKESTGIMFHGGSDKFVDDALSYINNNYNLTADEEYSILIENCVRSISVICEFQKMILMVSKLSLNNETSASIINGYVSHFITEVISAKSFIEEVEKKFLGSVPDFPKSDLLIPQFDKLYPNLKGIRNTLEHNAERRRGLKVGRVPIRSISPLVKPDGTQAKCGELVVFPPSLVKCHLSDGTVGEVDLELVTQYVCRLLTETVKRFPLKKTSQ